MAKTIKVSVAEGSEVSYEGETYKEGDTFEVDPSEEVANVLLESGHIVKVETKKKAKE